MMQKKVRRSVVFLLIFALLFANFASAGTAFASETGSAEENQFEDSSDKQQQEIVENGDGENEETAEPDKKAGEEASDSVNKDVAEPEVTDAGKEGADDAGTVKDEETADDADNMDSRDTNKEGAPEGNSNEEEAKSDKTAGDAEKADLAGQTPAEEPSEKKDDKPLSDETKKTNKKGALRANSDRDVEFKELTLVVAAIGKTESPLELEYQVKLWTENGDGDVPFANQTLPSGETTDAEGVVKKSMQLPAGESSVSATIKVPKGYYFKATLSPDETDEAGLFFYSNNARASEGITDYTDYYNTIVCNAYVKPEVHINLVNVEGSLLSNARLQISDYNNEVVDSWTSGDSEHVVRLLPNINGIAGNYYSLHEEEAPAGYSRADVIEFKVFPDPTGVVIDNTQYKDYTIHMVNEKNPGSLRVEMDFDTKDNIIDSDTNAFPFYVTVEIDGLRTSKSYTYHYTYGQYEGDRTVYLGPNNKTFTQQLHSYDYLVLRDLPDGAKYSVSQQTASDNRYEDPVYDEFKMGTIESNQEAKTVITNAPRLYTWSLTKEVPGAYNGQEFEFGFYFVDDFFQWGSAPHYYEINGERFELQDVGHEHGAGGTIDRTRLGATVHLKSGDTVTVPNIGAAAHYYYAEKSSREPGYEGYTSSSGGMIADYTVTAVNVSKMVAIRKLDQDGNHVAGAKLQILGYDHSIVIDEFTTTDEDYFWIPKNDYLSTNHGSDQFYLHEVSAPGGYLVSEEDIPFTYEKGERVKYTAWTTGPWSSEYYYEPYVVTVNGESVENNTIVMTDKPTDVTISKTDITGEEEIGGASLAVYRREDFLEDEELILGKEPIDSWTSEEGKSHRIIGILEAGHDFILIETTAPDGYEKAENIIFSIATDGSVRVDGGRVTDSTVTMVDEYSDHTVKISKTDVGGKEIAGAEITITGRAKGESEDIDKITYTTDGESPHEVTLGPGTYTMTEVTAPEGYVKAESITFTVEIDGTVLVDGEEVTDSTVMMVDEYFTSDVKISKTDVGGKEIAGAVITITGRADGESEDIEEIKYTTDGKKPHEVQLRPGTYTMTEVTAPEGYEKAESISFTLDNDGVVKVDGREVTDSTVTMVDEYSTHTVKISKTDVGGKEIAGAEITITGRADGESEDIEEIKYTTDGKKPHEVQLRPGTYTMTEVTAPEGYEKAESITFTVKADGTVLVGGKNVNGKVTMIDKEKTTKKTTNKKSKGGRTGDESGVMMYMAIIAAAATGLAAVLLRRRRRS